MSDRNMTYDASEQETFGFVDDEEQTEEPLEDEILDARDYKEADRFGMTPEEERRGTPIEERLAAEVPETSDDAGDPRVPDPGPIPDEPDPNDPAEPTEPDPNRPLPDEPAPPQPW